MKHAIKNYLSLLLIMLITSCNQEEQNAIIFNLADHDFKEWNKLIRIESITQLEQKDSCILNVANRCVMYKEYIFIYDAKVKAIYQFTTNGKFIRKIGERGRSDSEYIDIKDLCVDSINQTLLASDERGIISYSMINGEFKGRRKFNWADSNKYIKFKLLNEDNYLCINNSGDKKVSIVLNNHNGENILRKRKTYPFFVDYFLTSSLFVPSNSGY